MARPMDKPEQMSREERLAAKLRENLRRRKAQARAHEAGHGAGHGAGKEPDPALSKGEEGR